jgi:chemotaxis protein MotB
MSALDEPPKEEGGEDWLVTYADAITLLMAFFVLLYTVSEPNQHKFETKMGGVFEQFSGEKTAMPLQDLREQVSTLISETGEATEAKTTDSGISFEFKSAKMFAPGSAQILESGIALLDRVAQMVTFMGYDDYRVEVQGHTDDIPINTVQFPSNWELSAARAAAVVRFLVSRGVEPERLVAVGYGDTRPKAPNRDEAGQPIPENQSQNRRVEIEIER